jgi:meiotically up-regulated gene 157 (Mug157) protein
MKRENFERASVINEEIKRLQAIDKVLINACSNRNHLGAVSVDCYGHFEVLSDTDVPPLILAKFRQIIADEALKLDKEFEEL